MQMKMLTDLAFLESKLSSLCRTGPKGERLHQNCHNLQSVAILSTGHQDSFAGNNGSFGGGQRGPR